MSVFQSIEVPCPSCKTAVPFELVHSVNAARRPDLRAAILERSFQRQDCPACGFSFRMEPEFTYLDVGRKQFFAVWPAGKLAQCQALEARAVASFDKAFGPESDAKSLGEGMLVRVVFGWAGLNEKLIAADNAIDDRTLELAKIAVMRSLGEAKVGTDREFRLLGVTPDTLVVGWLHTSTEELDEEISVPRELLAEIEAQPADWAALLKDVAGTMFVDYRRGMFAEAG
jgi:hypothetical protein